MAKGHREYGGYLGATSSVGITDMGQPNPTVTYETLTFTASSKVTLVNNGTTSVSIFKNSGTPNWDSQAYTAQSYTAPLTLEFSKVVDPGGGDNGLSYAMIGFNVDPTTDASYSSLDHAAYPYKASNWARYHNGTGDEGLASWNPALRNYVVYGKDGYIRHYNGPTLLYTSALYGSNTVYIDSSFYVAHPTFCRFDNVRLVRKEWNGYQYV
jgi:hypothetical protein